MIDVKHIYHEVAYYAVIGAMGVMERPTDLRVFWIS